MKKLILLTIISINSFLTSYGDEIKGFFINNNGDTIDALFIVPVSNGAPDFVDLQKVVKCFDKNNNNFILRPEDAKEINFIFNSTEIRMLSFLVNGKLISNFASTQRYFLHLAINGKLKLYKLYYYKSTSVGVGMVVATAVALKNKFIFQKQDGELYKPNRTSFRKKMSIYLSDCPDLAQKIRKRKNTESDYTLTEIEYIVIDYNRQCGN